jgi:hypothetical protein
LRRKHDEHKSSWDSLTFPSGNLFWRKDREFVSFVQWKGFERLENHRATGFPKTMDRSSLNQSPTKKVGKGIQTI